MRRPLLAALVLGLGLVLCPGNVVHAAEPPAEFGRDWDDPVTAAPPVDKPDGPSCRVKIADEKFRDFTPYKGTYEPPKQCAGRWSKVVLRMEGAVAGRQYDRLGYLSMGGVTVFKTSTPEPSPDGIRWSVEKDVTRYTDLLSRPQPVEMLIGNVVDDTYTGVIDVQVHLTFYQAEKGDGGPARGDHPRHPTGTGTPDRVLPLSGARQEDGSLTGDVTVPRNTERLLAEVYATGSGGGCEEFWYLSTRSDTPYSCHADNGPYREVQVSVDGRLAGIAAPYPHVYTGGWSNPFLWYTVPAPRAFDIKPIAYDLTPFAGLLNDGRAHEIKVTVLGVSAGQTGWDTPTDVLVWQDSGRERVSGELVRHHEGRLTDSSEYTPATDARPEHRVDSRGAHSLATTGYVDTSHGRVYTSVDRRLAAASAHLWTDGENKDALTASWDDREKVTVTGGGTPAVTSEHRRYTMDGATAIGAGDRLNTVMTLTDSGTTAAIRRGRPTLTRFDDTYRGDATFTLNVPRDQRHAVGTSSERYRITGTGGGYDRTTATRNGFLVTP
ncbi:peptide-N4-asparagine amidase [Wenjunlia tyrosinilytica]|uniref:Peptide N-acetyl-beta-D-glucosaminyl asparaginase amidase A N-terminal domain-containing protein n=1 Tax=Wenjunlia tyrosinilytica TaxID=1544741 RepID=A0A917ZWJ2_9ACTN|nr:hypothetical protein GCM10012280_53920 [Wenjunlia tyrosinilytica]